MRARTSVALAVALLCLVILAAGCGRGGEQSPPAEGERKIDVEQSGEGGGGKVTLEGEEGQSTIEVQEEVPSEESLGAPIYPKATYVPGSGVSGKTTSGEKEFEVSGAEFTTGDKLSKVVEWYKTKLGDPVSGGSAETTWIFQDTQGKLTAVIVEPADGAVKITIGKVSGDLDIKL
ncbi:MAG: hypothetical protein HPY75_13040 [Actinobacteria bacterium]|nr:hypothetical protein [Actinomycetota bacterium]